MADNNTALWSQMMMQGMPGMWGDNPYSDYPGKLTMPGFTGDATDAQGNPIASWTNAKSAADKKYADDMAAYNAGQQQQTPGTTINSTSEGMGLQPLGTPQGSAPIQGPNASMTGPQYSSWLHTPEGSAWSQRQQNLGNADIASQAAATQLSSGGFGAGNGNPEMYRAMLNQASGYLNASTPQPATAPAAPTPPAYPDMRQAYLNALANPGHVTTPGANMMGPPASPTGPAGGGTDVMSSFLSNFRPTVGGGTNQSFLNQMKQLNGTS